MLIALGAAAASHADTGITQTDNMSFARWKGPPKR
jgi:hypothetical protein